MTWLLVVVFLTGSSGISTIKHEVSDELTCNLAATSITLELAKHPVYVRAECIKLIGEH